MPPDPGPLAGTVFDEFAGIYHGLAARNIAPPVADEMELWEIGAVFGLHLPPENDEPEDPYAGFDPIKARVEALEKGLPPPTAPPPSRPTTRTRPTLRPTPGRKRGA